MLNALRLFYRYSSLVLQVAATTRTTERLRRKYYFKKMGLGQENAYLPITQKTKEHVTMPHFSQGKGGKRETQKPRGIPGCSRHASARWHPVANTALATCAFISA